VVGLLRARNKRQAGVNELLVGANEAWLPHGRQTLNGRAMCSHLGCHFSCSMQLLDGSDRMGVARVNVHEPLPMILEVKAVSPFNVTHNAVVHSPRSCIEQVHIYNGAELAYNSLLWRLGGALCSKSSRTLRVLSIRKTCIVPPREICGWTRATDTRRWPFQLLRLVETKTFRKTRLIRRVLAICR
jgi:hypothetical protein